MSQLLLRRFAAPLLSLLGAAALAPPASAAVPAPVLTVPATSTGSYSISWSGIQSFEDTYTLEESTNGGAWVIRVDNDNVASKSFTKTSDGARAYRVKHCITTLPGDGGTGPEGCSAWSTVQTVNVYIQPSGAPNIGCTGCTSPDTNGDYTITWTRPTGTVTHFRLFERFNGGAFQRIDLDDAVLSRAYDNKADGTYDYQVDACNTLVNGNCSSDDSAIRTVTVLKTPSVPGGVTLPASDTDGGFALSWSAATGSVANYKVFRRPAGSGDFVEITPAGTGLSRSFTNHPDGNFDFAVKACNSGSCSNFSATRTIAVLKVPSVPGTPYIELTGVSAPEESGNFRLDWNDSVQTVAKYEIWRRHDGGSCATGNTGFSKVEESTESQKVFSAHADGAYRFRVKACNASGCSADSETACTVIAKSPQGLPNAAPANLPVPQGALAGTLEETAGLDGGKVTYTVKIPLPPGRNGMAPTVSLSYRSGEGDGIAGIGWQLSAGQGSVYRCPSLEAIDGTTRPYAGETSDRLCLDGQPLLLVGGSYGAAGSTYRPEMSPFTTVRLVGGGSTSTGSSFEVTDRSGTQRRYALAQVPPRADGGAGYPTQWMLTRVQDLHGNTMDYAYGASAAERLLQTITYTGYCSGSSCSAGTRVVAFEYEPRPLPLSGFNAQGFRYATTQRLKAITTAVNLPGSGAVHYVKLRYHSSDLSGRSLLAGVQLCANASCAADASYPESRFAYNEQVQAFTPRLLVDGEFDERRSLGDIDGDGRTDYVLYEREVMEQPEPTELRLSTEAAPRALDHWMNADLRLALEGDYLRGGKPRPSRDFNNDGRNDLVRLEGNVLQVGVWNLAQRRIDSLSTNLTVDADTFWIESTQDFDRDGDADLMYSEKRNGTYRHYLRMNCSNEHTVQIRFCDGEYLLPEPPSSRHSAEATDFNGDGLPDLVYNGTSSGGDALATYVRFGHMAGNDSFSFGAALHLGEDLGGPVTPVRGLDVNGDGIGDYFDQRYVQDRPGEPVHPETRLWLGIGNGRFAATTVIGTIAIDKDIFAGAVAMDYDQDGRDDLLVPDAGELITNYCYLYATTQTGGPPSEGPQEPIDWCAAGAHRFDQGSPIPHFNRAVYGFDQIVFVPQADGSYALQRRETALSGPIFASGACDSNDDGQPDWCYRLRSAYAPVHNPLCDPALDPDHCVFAAGNYVGAVTLGEHALENNRGQNSGFGFDLLQQATNGLGLVNAWNYGALSGAGHSSCSYGSARPLYQSNPASATPGHYHFSASMTVATRHAVSNGVGGSNAECLRYEDAMYSSNGRGFQGFKAISSDEDLGDGQDKTTRTEYYDYFPLTGVPFEIQTRLLSDAAGTPPLSASVRQWEFQRRPDGTYFVYQERQSDDTHDFDLPGRPLLKRDIVDLIYDGADLDYGNVSIRLDTTDTFEPSGQVLVRNQTQSEFGYDYGVAGTGWIDKLVRRKVTVYPTQYSNVLPGPPAPAEANNTKVVNEDYAYHAGARRLLERKTVQKNVAGEELGEVHAYDEYGNATRTTFSAPNRTARTAEIVYDNAGAYFPVRTIDPKGFVTEMQHHRGFGVVEYQHNPDDTTVESYLDFAGRAWRVRHSRQPPLDTAILRCESGCGHAVVRTAVVQDGHPSVITDLDLLGRAVKTVVRGASFNAAGPRDSQSTVSYDARGRKTAESQPAHAAGAHLAQYLDYDALGRYGRKVVSRAGHAVTSQTWRYDHRGLVTTITLPGGELTASRRHDGSGRLLSTTDAAQSSTHYRYDGLGNKVLSENALGTQVRWFHDNLGRKTRVEDPDAGAPGAPAERISYDGYGQIASLVNAKNDTIAFTYDVLGRPLTRSLNGSAAAFWEYDQNGMPSLSQLRSSDSNGNGQADFRKSVSYDEYNRPVRIETAIDGSPRTFVEQLGYDDYYGRIKGRRLPSGEVVLQQYDAHGNLNGERQWWDAAAVHQEYYRITERNARGQVLGLSYGNGATATMSYVDSTGDVAAMRYDAPDGTDLADLRYAYDDAFGNLTRREDRVPGVTETFAYDNRQRLASSSVVWSNAAIAPRAVDYVYDAVGNLTRKSDFGSTYHYGNAARSAGGNAGPHAVWRVDLAGGGVHGDFAYDATGNMTAGMGRTIAYDAFNQPTTIVEAGKTTRYRYGPELDLIAREEGGMVVYTAGSFQFVLGADGVQTERSFIGAHAVVERSGETRKVRYQHVDRLGSLVAVTNETGAVTERHGFDAFGKPLEGDWQDSGGLLHSPGTGAEQLTEKGYTGHEHLDDHKLVHMGGRVYDPRLGRFLSVDPFIQSEASTQSQNAYSYVMNNPLSGVDPSGYTCHGAGSGGCGAWQDYQHSKQIHQMQQPLYNETRSGADMIADFVAYSSFIDAERVKEKQRNLLYSLGHTSFFVGPHRDYIDEDGNRVVGREEVIVNMGSIRPLYGEEQIQARLQAGQWLRDFRAQYEWSVGRYHQFKGPMIHDTVRPLAEWGSQIATLPMGMGLSSARVIGFGALMNPRNAAVWVAAGSKSSIFGHNAVAISMNGQTVWADLVVAGMLPENPVLRFLAVARGGMATAVRTQASINPSYGVVGRVITQSQAQAMAQSIVRLQPGAYNLFTNSCTTFCRTAMEAGGIQAAWWGRSPWLLYQSMR